MKKSNLLCLLILPFVFASCDFLDKFNHFGMGNTFEETFSISVSDGEQSFSEDVSFDASDDATLEENFDKISHFEVTRISIRITSFEGDPTTMADMVVSITSKGETVGEPFAVPSFNLNSEEEILLDLSDPNFRAIEDAYLTNRTITMIATGLISNTPVEVDFTVYMTVEATFDTKNK